MIRRSNQRLLLAQRSLADGEWLLLLLLLLWQQQPRRGDNTWTQRRKERERHHFPPLAICLTVPGIMRGNMTESSQRKFTKARKSRCKEGVVCA